MVINLDLYFTKSDNFKAALRSGFFVCLSFKCYDPQIFYWILTTSTEQRAYFALLLLSFATVVKPIYIRPHTVYHLFADEVSNDYASEPGRGFALLLRDRLSHTLQRLTTDFWGLQNNWRFTTSLQIGPKHQSKRADY